MADGTEERQESNASNTHPIKLCEPKDPTLPCGTSSLGTNPQGSLQSLAEKLRFAERRLHRESEDAADMQVGGTPGAESSFTMQNTYAHVLAEHGAHQFAWHHMTSAFSPVKVPTDMEHFNTSDIINHLPNGQNIFLQQQVPQPVPQQQQASAQDQAQQQQQQQQQQQDQQAGQANQQQQPPTTAPQQQSQPLNIQLLPQQVASFVGKLDPSVMMQFPTVSMPSGMPTKPSEEEMKVWAQMGYSQHLISDAVVKAAVLKNPNLMGAMNVSSGAPGAMSQFVPQMQVQPQQQAIAQIPQLHIPQTITATTVDGQKVNINAADIAKQFVADLFKNEKIEIVQSQGPPLPVQPQPSTTGGGGGGKKSKKKGGSGSKHQAQPPDGGIKIPRKHRCLQCSYETDNKSHLRRHENSVHSSFKQYMCYVCAKEFSRSEKIRGHFLKFHPNIPYNPAMVKKSNTAAASSAPVASVAAAVAMATQGPSMSHQGKAETSTTMGVSMSGALVNPCVVSDVSQLGLATGVFPPMVQQPANAQPQPLNMETNAQNAAVNTSKASSKDASERRFKCDKCCYSGKDSWHLKRHMSDVHDDVKEFHCPKCSYATSRKHRIISHMKGHGELSCLYCPFVTHDIDGYMQHVRNCAREHRLSTAFTCEHCSGGFPSRRMLNTHLQKAHNITVLQCELCPFSTQEPHMFEAHKQTHQAPPTDVMKPSEHFCTTCNEAFDCKERLDTHMHTVHAKQPDYKPEDQFRCGVCNFTTIYHFVMKNHMRMHTGELFECDVPGCDFKAAWKQSVKIHAQMQHGAPEEHVCPVCQKGFTKKEMFIGHMKTHDAVLTCYYCGDAFTQAEQLSEHMEMHKKDRPDQGTAEQDITDAEKAFKCEYTGCKYRCKFRETLKHHLETVHNIKLDYACPLCPHRQPFKHAANFDRHLKNHSKEQKCGLCGAVFSLRVHLRQHVAEKHGLQVIVERINSDEEEEDNLDILTAAAKNMSTYIYSAGEYSSYTPQTSGNGCSTDRPENSTNQSS